MLSTNLYEIMSHPSAFGQWLVASDFSQGPTYEIAIDDNRNEAKAKELVNTV